jgi:hypothetical protein
VNLFKRKAPATTVVTDKDTGEELTVHIQVQPRGVGGGPRYAFDAAGQPATYSLPAATVEHINRIEAELAQLQVENLRLRALLNAGRRWVDPSPSRWPAPYRALIASYQSQQQRHDRSVAIWAALAAASPTPPAIPMTPPTHPAHA